MKLSRYNLKELAFVHLGAGSLSSESEAENVVGRADLRHGLVVFGVTKIMNMGACQTPVKKAMARNEQIVLLRVERWGLWLESSVKVRQWTIVVVVVTGKGQKRCRTAKQMKRIAEKEKRSSMSKKAH